MDFKSLIHPPNVLHVRLISGLFEVILSTMSKFIHPTIPFHLSAPEDVLLVIHIDGEMLVFALLDGVGASGDGSQLIELKHR